MDELLDFFENTPMNEYSEDEQIKDILKNLKQKIEHLKETDDWKEKEVKKMEKQKQ